MSAKSPTGRTSAELVELIQSTFRLDGDDLVRLSNGKVVTPPVKWPPWVFVKKYRKDGKRRNVNVLYHRAKFCLAHGYLPDEVDHRDTDETNHSLSNLRAATRSLQNHNKTNRKRRDLPRGVYKRPDWKRYRGQITYRKRSIPLGWFDTPEAASKAVEEKLRELYGSTYRPLS